MSNEEKLGATPYDLTYKIADALICRYGKTAGQAFFNQVVDLFKDDVYKSILKERQAKGGVK